jgi:hypothetical protein
MLGLSIFVIVLVTLIFLFRLKRQREIEAFKDADFSNFNPDNDRSATNSGEIEEITARAITAAARMTENPTASDAPESPEAEIEYQKREAVFDDVTGALLLTLYQVLDNEFQVLVKVPVSDLIRSRNPAEMSVLLPGDKVDFVICQKADLKVVCGIQLGGGAVDSISAMFKEVGIPFITLGVGAAYSATELKDKLEGVLPTIRPVHQCSGCRKTMSIKMARSGKHEGSYFWVCAECKVTVPVR